MTEEYKDRLIAKMLDSPSSLSDEELDAIANDEELMGIHEMSAELSGSCIRQPEIDIEKEWAVFRPRIRRRRPMARLMRAAAIFIGVALVSVIIAKMSDYTFAPSEPTVVAEADRQLPVGENRQSSAAASEMPVSEKKAADDMEKKASSDSKSGRKNIPSNCLLAKTDVVEPERLDEMMADIDVDEYIRIQQAKVDNDLAMQHAELYQSQRRVLAQMIDMIDGAGDLDTDYAKTVIMQ